MIGELFELDNPLWRRDYLEALAELNEGQLFLPPPKGARPEEFWTTVVKAPEPRDVRELDGSALRLAILEGMQIRKTADPLIREVVWEDALAGRVAQSPWQLLVWLSDKERRHPFYSLREAAMFTVAVHLGKVDASV
jgi:hypothetical protein